MNILKYSGLLIPLIRRNFDSGIFFIITSFMEQPLENMLPQRLQSSSLRSVVICRTYSQNIYLIPSPTSMQQPYLEPFYFDWPLDRLLGEHLGKKYTGRYSDWVVIFREIMCFIIM